MTYQVSISRNIEAEDEKTAALEGYKQIMLAGISVATVTVYVRNTAGITKTVRLDIGEADYYAGFNQQSDFRPCARLTHRAI